MNWETGEEDGSGWGEMVARDREEERAARQHERAEKQIIDLKAQVELLQRERDGYKSAAERIEDLRRRETADHEAELLLIWRTAMPIKVLAEGKQPCPVVLIDRIVELLRYEERCGADKGGNRP